MDITFFFDFVIIENIKRDTKSTTNLMMLDTGYRRSLNLSPTYKRGSATIDIMNALSGIMHEAMERSWKINPT